MLNALIRELREGAGKSRDDVQQALGVSRATVYAWEAESNPIPPSAENLHAFLELVGASGDKRLEVWRLRAAPRPDQVEA